MKWESGSLPCDNCFSTVLSLSSAECFSGGDWLQTEGARRTEVQAARGQRAEERHRQDEEEHLRLLRSMYGGQLCLPVTPSTVTWRVTTVGTKGYKVNNDADFTQGSVLCHLLLDNDAHVSSSPTMLFSLSSYGVAGPYIWWGLNGTAPVNAPRVHVRLLDVKVTLCNILSI